MKTYISILRGINVSGNKPIKMDTLREMYQDLGFRDVKTYVQSGNVIFSSEEMAPAILEQNISRQIETDFGFEVPVLVLTVDKLSEIIASNPFVDDQDKEPSFLHVTFLAAPPAAYDQMTIENKKQNGEKISFSNTAVYLYCPNGYGRTKLTNNFLEARLKVKATTRNWKTTTELLRLASPSIGDSF
ncbi:DUF1697 domain-containing protein [Litoribacter alkaliphilus]|uniref:DUF1697 domain-containing protein n=1 Tax=Litoribacter ruber TaxID=702568 RepID=A0AAP2CG66_9BACT|nr:DUF1697 domain-containing protein [Litoribacter alkaliphilus]MBS9522581.1 DUF1697 domain-containing protein [Litoribacter alkaliphilus]